jgi:Uma2 family endonuclease
MAILLSPTTQPVILEGVSWATYERLLADVDDSNALRCAYNQGTLEIMTPSFDHERLNRLLAELVAAIATGLDLDYEQAGSTTFKREDVGRGFEPDSCFYLAHAETVRGQRRIDLATDPPPDLVLEIDITHPSLDKLPIYAAVGVPEVWRYDGNRIVLYGLTTQGYEELNVSLGLAGVTCDELTALLELSGQLRRGSWVRHVQTWAQTHHSGPGNV